MKVSYLLAIVTMLMAGSCVLAVPVQWQLTTLDPTLDVRCVVPMPNGDIYVAARGAGIFHSADRGQTWTTLNNGLPDFELGPLIVAQDGTMVVSVGRNPGEGTWWYDGAIWRQCPGVPTGGWGVLAMDKTAGGDILVGHAWTNTITVSTDNGRTFTQRAVLPNSPNGWASSPYAMARGPDGTMYLGTEIGGVLYSRDDGRTWATIPNTDKTTYPAGNIAALGFNNAGELLCNLGVNPSRLVGGVTGTWVAMAGFPIETRLNSFTKTPDGQLFTVTRRYSPQPPQVCTSTDGGASWTGASDGLPPAATLVCNSVVVSPDNYLYLATKGGLYRTTTAICVPGDANGDGKIAFTDYIVLEGHFGKTGAVYADGDFNGDGVVNFKDYIILEGNFGQSAPEPVTLVVLGVGAVAMVRRHGRAA